MIYSVIDMDIVGSRNIEFREVIQEKLRKYFFELNNKYSSILAANIGFTLGDEWQILLNAPEESYNMVFEINSYLKTLGIKTYAGIGIGSISTKVYSNTSDMDGKAFIYAREALNLCKERRSNLSSKHNRVYLMGEYKFPLNKYSNIKEVALTSLSNMENNKTQTYVINTLIENTEILFNKVTLKQLEVMKLYEKYNSYNKMVHCGVINSKSDISQKLNAAEYFAIVNNKSCIRELLINYIENAKDLLI